MEKIKVIIADDSAFVRDGMRIILEMDEQFEVLGCAENGKEAVALARQKKCDVALMDIQMPIMDGIEATKIFVEEQLGKVLILTTFDDDELVERGLKCGAKGYLIKNHTPDELKQMILSIYHGGNVIDEQVYHRFVNGMGMSNKEISAKLFISEGTVKNYISTILEKEGLAHRTQLAIYYLTGKKTIELTCEKQHTGELSRKGKCKMGTEQTNEKQLDAAACAMTEWLSHPQELGKAPAKLACAGTFQMHNMKYYIFKYKKSLMGKWLLGVCGGYEENALEHCGHVFSEMELYSEDTAEERAKELVERVRTYWQEKAKEAEEKNENTGMFVSFVLLENAKWDKQLLLQELKDTWQIEDELAVGDAGEDEEKHAKEDKDMLVFRYKQMMLTVLLIPSPVPDGEADDYAKGNYMWKDAGRFVRRHQAHLMVAVLGAVDAPLEGGKLLVKTVVSCCKQKGVLGIYANETVYEPKFYLEAAELVKENMIPLLNLVWIGLYREKEGTCGYTCGLRSLGYDEIEVIGSSADYTQVRDFLLNVAVYIADENVTLHDGETIGFFGEERLRITKSAGKAIEGETLKIAFP